MDNSASLPACLPVAQVLDTIKAALDVVLAFFDDAIDYLIDLFYDALINAIPEISILFKPFDFDTPFRSFVEQQVKEFNDTMNVRAVVTTAATCNFTITTYIAARDCMQAAFATVADVLSFENLNPVK